MAQTYGLTFLSHDQIAEKRTSLTLFPNKTFQPEGNFTLSFEINLIPDKTDYFGTIFRITENGQRNISLVYSNSAPFYQPKTYNFKLIDGDRLSNIIVDVPPHQLFTQWTKFNLVFDRKNDQIVLTTPYFNHSFVQKKVHLKAMANYNILFGVNNETSDSPPMIIRNVEIKTEDNKVFSWPLNEIAGAVAHDASGNSDAMVNNPMWLRAKHHNWTLQKEVKLSGHTGVAFNEKEELLYIVSSDSLWTYNLKTLAIKSTAYQSGRFNDLKTNQFIYNPVDHKIYNYAIGNSHENVNTYSFSANQWDESHSYTGTELGADYWNTNNFFGNDSLLYVVGGYGHYTYRNTIKSYDPYKKKWSEIKPKGDFFWPHYLSAAGIADSGKTAYFIGGYGSKTGEQILNPRYYYDLFKYDLKTQKITKVYSLKNINTDFVFANSMIIDQKTRTFKALIFPNNKYYTHFGLLEGSLDNPEYKLAGNEIPFYFHDVTTFTDLYYAPVTQQLVSVVINQPEPGVKGKTEVKIYTISNPPDILPDQYSSSPKSLLWYFIGEFIILALLCFLGIKFLKTRPKKLSKAGMPNTDNDGKRLSNTTEMPITVSVDSNDKQNALFLFGDLSLIASGEDLTKDLNFTTLLKDLFLLILIHSIGPGRGIVNEKLIDILWANKSEESAKNNRAANLSRLKTILAGTGNISLVKIGGQTGNKWQIEINARTMYFDYYEYLQIINSKAITKDNICSLMDITQRGSFLSNFNYPWLDQIKSETSNEIIDFYSKYATTIKVEDNPEFCIKLANSMFHLDSVNEEAMFIKCKALACLGKHSLAKLAFENFVKEYRSLYGEDFKKDFHHIL